MHHFTFANQIMPLNGQVVAEFANGLDCETIRRWADSDRAQFPQAERQVKVGHEFCLVVADDGTTYEVSVDELPND